MSRGTDLARLQAIADLVRDQRLSRLRNAADLRTQSLMQIAALERDADQAADLPPVAAGLVALRYQAWADVRRQELNAVLARQSADWIEARDHAARAFGRAEALRAIALRQRSKS